MTQDIISLKIFFIKNKTNNIVEVINIIHNKTLNKKRCYFSPKKFSFNFLFKFYNSLTDKK